LLRQYKDNPDKKLVQHFDLLFIQQSVDKLSSQEQIQLIPILLQGISEDAGKPACATIFNLFLRLLPQFRLPSRGTQEDGELRATLGFSNESADAEFISLWFGKLMLFNLSKPDVGQDNRPLPGGLSNDDYLFLTASGKVDAWNPRAPEGLNLTNTKITVLQFLTSGAFIDGERFFPALYAAADANSKIYSIGEEMLKRSTVSLEDESIIENLFEVYEKQSKPALRTRILALLSKSSVATSFPDRIIHVVQYSMRSAAPGSEPIQGLEATKLRNAVFYFLNWVSRSGSPESLKRIAPTIIQFCREYVEEQGWPTPTNRSSADLSLRALAYETVGAMAKTVPSEVLKPNLDLIRWLFRSLTEENSGGSISISIEEALSSILGSIPSELPADVRGEMRQLLLENISKTDGEEVVRSARFVAVKWANHVLTYDDIVARWMDLLALGEYNGQRSDVIEEGRKGLDPYWYRLLRLHGGSGHLELPNWVDLVKVFFSDQTLMGNSHIANTMRTGMEIDGVSVFGNFANKLMASYPHAVSFCRQILLVGAFQDASTVGKDADWERQLNVLLRTDVESRSALRKHLQSLDRDALTLFLTAAFEGMIYDHGKGLPDCARTFVEIASLVDTEALAALAPRAHELQPAVQSNDPAIRSLAAKALGMLAAHPAYNDDQLSRLVLVLAEDSGQWKETFGAASNSVHGALVALAHILNKSVFYGRTEAISSDTYANTVRRIFEIISEATDATIKEAAFIAIGLLSSVGIISSASLQALQLDITNIVEIITKESKKGTEAAITALGRLAMMYDEADTIQMACLNRVVEALYSMYELRQIEVQFTVGEAIAVAIAGWSSKALILTVDVQTSYTPTIKPPMVLPAVLQKLLSDCRQTKPALRRASGVWLFTLISNCGQLPDIQTRLRDCQGAFMALLSAREDIVQETASRGLSLVYEQGNKELKEHLVSDLVASFTGSTAKIQVDAETELFEPDALPTGDGQSVTSYKDIMNLAAEVGDQSLVYKFMALASNAATWSTRAAFGRFGLSSILSESAVDPKLYPKLYRYRFDPNPNVQRSMNDIWSSLVPSSTTTIDEHFDAIMEDLLKNILGKEWRTREASCAAIADLVQGKRFGKYEKFLKRIWEVAFKVLDDIKGSVRKAAEKLCQVLTNILVRQLEEGTSPKNAQAMLKEVIPFLFSTRGLESPSKEVQSFAYDTVIKMIKSGGTTLRPFIPSLVEQILGLLSTLEPDIINYLHMNADRYDTTQEKIDEARSMAISHSPMMNSIERCLDLLDEASMAELTPHLQTVIKTAVGMPSKVGCSGVLVALATRHSFLFRPHADSFLKLIQRAVLDRNSTVSAAYSRASGYISRLASEEQLLAFAGFSKGLYFSADASDTNRQVSADIVYAISKFASDRFNALATTFLDFVFFAKHDTDTHVKEMMTKTWDENVGGSRAALLYLREIVNSAQSHLESPKWSIKHTAALTIADVAVSAGNNIDVANAVIIWPALEKALAMKTFEGKEKVLESFVKFVEHAKPFWSKEEGIAAQMTKIALREAKRNNDSYRPHAFACLGGYAEARSDLDLLEAMREAMWPKVQEMLDEDVEMTNGNENPGASTATGGAELLTKYLDAMFRGFQDASIQSGMHNLEVVLDDAQRLLTNHKASIQTKSVFYERIKALMDGIVRSKPHTQLIRNSATFLQMWRLLEVSSGSGNESTRAKRLQAAAAFVDAVVAGDVVASSDPERQALTESISKDLEAALKYERAAGIRSVIVKCKGQLQ
jgi:proteasome component ECM29